jgi:hypothetical protein
MSKKVIANRRTFRSRYGNRTVNIVRDTANGRSARVIAQSLRIKIGTVAAVRANLTRGNYAPFAFVNRAGVVIGNSF